MSSSTPTPPQAPQKSYGLFIFGCILLIIVDFLWTLSSVLVQKLLDEYYNKPIIITYCSTSVFALYVPFFYFSNWVRSFFYSCRIKRALRQKYQNEVQFYNTANETTSLIGSNPHTPRYSQDSFNNKDENSNLLSISHSNLDSNSPYNDPSVQPYLPNQSSNTSSHDEYTGHYNIDDRINRDMEYLDGIETERDSQLYNDIRSYRVLVNERGWKVFKHNFKTGMILGPVWYTMNVTYNSALKMVSVSTNTILSTTAGFFVLLIGLVVFCIPVRKLHLLCVALAIFGSFLVVVLGANNSDEDPDTPHSLFDKIVGPALCLLSAFLYGLYSVVIEYFTDKEKPLEEQKDSIAKQRKEAEEEEEEEQKRAEIEAQALFLPMASSSTPLHNSQSGFMNSLDRSHSINTLHRATPGVDDVSVHVANHMEQTSFDITTSNQDNFGFGVCREQHIIENLRVDPTGASLGLNPDELELTFADSDDEEVERNLLGQVLDQLLPNYDINDPKLVTGLLFGCVGLINLVFAWPFIGLFHFTGFETLQFPDKRAIPMLVMNSFLGAAASDFLWANAVILTSPIIATLTIPGTIPIAMCYETFFLHKPLSLYAVLGSILIVASSSVVTIHQYNEDKKYDKMTKKMLDRRAEKKEKEKLQRRQYRERQRQIQQLIAQNAAQNKLAEVEDNTTRRGGNNNNNHGDMSSSHGSSPAQQQQQVARPEIGAQ